MPDYSLVPVDYQPDFGDFSLVPVDYDPFSADDIIQQARTQLASQPSRFPMAYGTPEADQAALQPETFVNPAVRNVLGSMATLPQRAIDASIADTEHYRQYGMSTDYVPQSIGPAAETALTMMGSSGIAPAGMISVAKGAATRLGSAARAAETLAPATAEGVGLGRTLAGGPVRAAESPEILSEELAGQTRSQIRDLAADKGLVPKGDPLHPDYPRRWNDPVTDERRLRLDRGHIDTETGQPYDIESAAADHVHGYDINGNPIEVHGDNHIPTKGE